MKTILLTLIFVQLLFANKNFIFEVESNTNTLYCGENLELTYIFKSKKDINIIERDFTPPQFSDFHTKDIIKFDIYEDENYNISKIKYILSPIEYGSIVVEPAIIDIATAKKKDIGTYKFEDTKYQTIESNTITLKVEKLPDNVKYIGNFSLAIKVDKNQTNSTKAVNLTINIQGIGNIEDILKFDIQIPHATIYSNTPVKTKNSFSQNIAILSSKSYTIKPIHINFFNKNLNKVIYLKTKETFIEVKSIPKTKPTSSKNNYLYILVSFILGIVSTFIILSIKKKKIYNPNRPLLEKIKEAKNNKELLNILLPLSHNKDILKLILSLEENLYKKENYKITKKEIISKVKEIFTHY